MRPLVAGLFTALVGLGWAQAQTTTGPTPDPAYDAYAKPQRLVKLADGRRIHVNCQGKGSPTVILTAGLGGSSVSWAKVQPALAKRTRTCTWDRAGFGHSDPSPAAQTLAATTADLEGALAAARIKGPYLVAGHSAGAFETLLFADRHRADVVGMVLVDGSVPNQAERFTAMSPALARASASGLRFAVDGQRRCATSLEAGTLKPDTPTWKLCFGYPPQFSPVYLGGMRTLDGDPARLRTRASLSEEFAASAAAVANPSRDYGDLPLVVLTQATGLGFPGATAAEIDAMSGAWRQWHGDYAKLSRTAVNLIVQGAGHNIQDDKPQAVIGAIDAVLAAARQP
ncbi:alpha/beta hydrolase [uncultured Phenylobacterium sp.]|uniref:alpha/beta hydrolase n=1 Tax=uncultured Phenylobacterium sp. TaxID=349273 RepID=UPI0025FCDC2F|nr:alpha/beta hydrolase [uncultured Phenylobacterium sp.]